MKILSEISAGEFNNKFTDHRDIKYFGKKFKHHYLAALTKQEYENIKINSSPLIPYPEEGSYPSINDAVKQFLKYPNYLKNTHPDRGISGTTVNKYLKQFKNGLKLEDCFIREELPAKHTYYVTDGMHRLVAYGVYKKLQIRDYEVKVYYTTDKDLF